MLEHRYDIRISESYVDPNPLMVEIQDPDNFTRFQTRERCALEIAAYVFKSSAKHVPVFMILEVRPKIKKINIVFAVTSSISSIC